MKIFLSIILTLLLTSVFAVASGEACVAELDCGSATDVSMVCCPANKTDTSVSPSVVNNITVCFNSQTPTELGTGTNTGYTVYCAGTVGEFVTTCNATKWCNTVDNACCLATKTGVRSYKTCGPSRYTTNYVIPSTISTVNTSAYNGYTFKCGTLSITSASWIKPTQLLAPLLILILNS